MNTVTTNDPVGEDRFFEPSFVTAPAYRLPIV